MKAVFDILGLGAVAVDDLLYVESYPPADAKAYVLRSDRQCGGLTATALVAASRLGARCAYAGVLGTDELSEFAIRKLTGENIDVTYAQRDANARVIHSYIVVDVHRHTRNVFADSNGVVGADPHWPRPELIERSRVLLVDHFGVPGMIRAARIARGAARRPVVADFERAPGAEMSELLELVDHLIISQTFGDSLTGESDPRAIVERLWSDSRTTVAVTCGAEGCWYRIDRETARVEHQPAFQVNAVDTTGCGDVFHGAYACALAGGLDLTECIRFASAAAALKAMRAGGQAGIPNRAAVETFLRERGNMA